MPKLPTITPNQMVKILRRCGFVERRQTGSHLILRHPIMRRIVPIPMHRGELKTGTLRSILRQADLSVEKLVELLHQ